MVALSCCSTRYDDLISYHVAYTVTFVAFTPRYTFLRLGLAVVLHWTRRYIFCSRYILLGSFTFTTRTLPPAISFCGYTRYRRRVLLLLRCLPE